MRAVERDHGVRRHPLPEATERDERAEEGRLGRVGQQELGREGPRGLRSAPDLDGKRGAGDEADGWEGRVEWPVAGGEEEQLEAAEPDEEEGGDGAEVDGGEGEGEDGEEEEHREERREAGEAGAQARGGEARVGHGRGHGGRDQCKANYLGRHAALDEHSRR